MVAFFKILVLPIWRTSRPEGDRTVGTLGFSLIYSFYRYGLPDDRRETVRSARGNGYKFVSANVDTPKAQSTAK